MSSTCSTATNQWRGVFPFSTGGEATSLIEAEAGEALSAEEVERLRSDVDYVPLFTISAGSILASLAAVIVRAMRGSPSAISGARDVRLYLTGTKFCQNCEGFAGGLCHCEMVDPAWGRACRQ